MFFYICLELFKDVRLKPATKVGQGVGREDIKNRKSITINRLSCINGGEAGIRTLGGDQPSTVFKTAAFGRSATSPLALYNNLPVLKINYFISF